MKLRIIPLGGVEEVGKNCTVFEYLPAGQAGLPAGRQVGDIIVVDLGFDFPGPDLPGVDYILPDVTYLEKNKNRIKGLVITHGHLDHIGAIPYFLEKLGQPPIFATPLALGLIQNRLSEMGPVRKARLNIIKPNQLFSLGAFRITPFRVVHNIPDSLGLAIETPLGVVIHTGDFKIDDKPVDQKPLQKDKLKAFAKKGVLALLSDSTNAALPGHSVPEKQVGKIIDQIIKQTQGRIIFTTFSTLISRIQQVVQSCQKHGRKIAIVGLAIKKSVAIAHELGYLSFPPKLFIDLKGINRYPDKKLVMLAGGAQGVEGSSMARIAENKHWLVKIKKGDTVVFSSSAVPGNELAIYQMMDGMVNQGAKIIYRAVLGSGVHSSGHAFQQELKEMLKLIKPKFFIPIEGQHYMQDQHIELAKELGIKEKNCFMLYNGQILEIDQDNQARVLKKKMANLFIIVEGKRVRVLKPERLEARNKMAESGICIVIIPQSRKRETKIDIVFKGLYLDDKTISETKNKAKKLIKKYGLRNNTKNKIQSSLGDFLLNKIGKKPLVVLIIN